MNFQIGSTLILTLIFLLLITITSTKILSGANTQQIIVNNYEEKEVAFRAAEEALRWVENTIVENTNFTLNDFQNGCDSSVATCFDSSCLFGLCDSVNYSPSAASITDCRTQGLRPWEDSSLWSTAPTTTISVSRSSSSPAASVNVSAKYLVEFRCYQPNVRSPNVTSIDPDEWAEYYRITVSVDGITTDITSTDSTIRSAPVMLQSTYKKN